MIHEITGLANEGVLPVQEKNLRNLAETITHSKWDKREMIVNDIYLQDVRLVSMLLGYKLFYSSRPNFVSIGVIIMAYKMVKENKKYNLSKILAQQFIENVKAIKKDKSKAFRFDSLLIHMYIHIIHNFPGMHPRAWEVDEHTGL